MQTKHIADESVTNSKLAANSVTSDKIAPGTIIPSDVAPGTVGNQVLCTNNAITASEWKKIDLTNCNNDTFIDQNLRKTSDVEFNKGTFGSTVLGQTAIIGRGTLCTTNSAPN